ncbi:hypothetical protein CBR_g48306 [Chara braunii]|uniref:Uncharacterized protein n=1 Tax=Chara braunii TaxID=69332 RepID=A0A388K449_CHABU|nr:hypothetical protein CBR_g48306 [Chara braunii]|eukprot:GBG64838.1 hypothetical protein CBR_g48306 [Chara braunii]
MKEVCEQMMGKKASCSQETIAAVCAVARCTEQESRWHREDVAAREQLEKQRCNEVDRLRRENEELTRVASGRANRELESLKADNQTLLQDVLQLKEEMEQWKRGSKRTRSSAAVTEKSPPAEPARGKTKASTDGQTPAEWAKLADAYQRVRDEKDMVEREVSALKERINRIKISSPSSSRKKVFVRRKSHKGGVSSPVRKEGDQVKVTFVRKVGEERDNFQKRVNNDLGKLRKAQLEGLCKDEGIEYGGVKKTAEDLADIYTTRAYEQPMRRRLIEDNNEEEPEEEDQEEGESADMAGAPTEASAEATTSEESP